MYYITFKRNLFNFLYLVKFKEFQSILALKKNCIKFFKKISCAQKKMAKQSMGFPFYNFSGRSDNKTYILNSLQEPLVQNEAYTEFGFDHYPMGFNAIVCVIAYTGGQFFFTFSYFLSKSLLI